jgi:ArsR family transcriptional regulator
MRKSTYKDAMNDMVRARVCAEVLKALAHPIRILLVEALKGGDQCVNDLCRLAPVDQSNISRHLTRLKAAGILSDRRVGTRVLYHLETPCIMEACGCATRVVRSEAARRSRALKGGGR